MLFRSVSQSRYESRDAILLDNLEHPPFGWRIWCAFIHHLRDAIDHRSIDDVRVASYPTDISSAPIHIFLWSHIKDIAMGESCLSEITTGCVIDTFWFRSRSRCVENEETMFAIKTLCRVFCALPLDNLMPPNIARCIPPNILAGSLYYK